MKKEGQPLRSLPFKAEEYKLIPRQSTFLDIGSGFGKPNFHAAMQIYPKESLGIEVVPARVSFCTDQKLTFEDQHKEKMRKDEAKIIPSNKKGKDTGNGSSEKTFDVQ